MKKIERGVMVMKDGKAWGVVYEDAQCRSMGWVDPVDAIIHNPEFCNGPLDASRVTRYTTGLIYHDEKELAEAKLVHVVRTTTVEIEE